MLDRVLLSEALPVPLLAKLDDRLMVERSRAGALSVVELTDVDLVVFRFQVNHRAMCILDGPHGFRGCQRGNTGWKEGKETGFKFAFILMR